MEGTVGRDILDTLKAPHLPDEMMALESSQCLQTKIDSGSQFMEILNVLE